MVKFWVLLLFIKGVFSTVLVAQPLNVSVRAKAAILYNPKNGAILFEKHAKQPHYPASITKIATALFVLDAKKMNLETHFIASSRALEVMNAILKQADPLKYPPYILEHDGVMLGIKEGESLSLKTLLHSLLLCSSNDAANVIAEGCSGSVEMFMEELNTYLKKKGILQTRFQNPHGLHHPAQLTTAYDMARIAGLAFDNEMFMKIDRTSYYEWPGHRTIENYTNRLLKKYQYPRAIGGKTGYTASSGFNLVVAAEDDGRRLIAVLLGCEKSEDRFKDAIALFEAAFREKPQKRLLFSTQDAHFTREVPKAVCHLQAKLKEDLSVQYFPAEEGKLSAHIHWHKLSLPVKKGELVGSIVVEDERGTPVSQASLFAENEVEKILYYKCADVFQNPFFAAPVSLAILLLILLKFQKKGRKLLK